MDTEATYQETNGEKRLDKNEYTTSHLLGETENPKVTEILPQNTISTAHQSNHASSIDEFGTEVKRRRINQPPEQNTMNSFISIIENEWFVDKSLLLETIIVKLFKKCQKQTLDSPVPKPFRFTKLNECPLTDPLLLAGPRRFGKTTNLEMMQAFFGGYIPQEKLEKLKIFQRTETMEWYSYFDVISITFGLSGGDISSKTACVEACRTIMHQAYKKYAYLKSYLDGDDLKAFEEWISEKEYKKKTENEISLSMQFLISCAYMKNNYSKIVLLFIDEFDRLSSKALFKVSREELTAIVNFYSDMIGAAAVKHTSNCYGIFTGVTALTSDTLSSLNNLTIVSVLNDADFFHFYGITLEEFDDILQRPGISTETKNLKDTAVSCYNGYQKGNISILNSYAVKRFIESSKIELYWRNTGIISGLSAALRCRNWRNMVMRLINGESISTTLLAKLDTTDFENFRNRSFDMINFDLTINLMVQQGYLCIDEEDGDGKAFVRVPNVEIQSELHRLLSNSFHRSFCFAQADIERCRDLLANIQISISDSCHKSLQEMKEILNRIVSSKKKGCH